MSDIPSNKLDEWMNILDNSVKQSLPPLDTNKMAAPAQASLVDTFCEGYPKAKPTLEAVCGIIAWVPSYGTLAAAILRGLIAIGQDIYDQGCPTKPQT